MEGIEGGKEGERRREGGKSGRRECRVSYFYHRSSKRQKFDFSLTHTPTHSLYILPNALTAVIVSKPPVVTPSAATVII